MFQYVIKQNENIVRGANVCSSVMLLIVISSRINKRERVGGRKFHELFYSSGM